MGYYDSLELAVRLSELLARYAKHQPLSLDQQAIWERCYPYMKQLLARPNVSRSYSAWLRKLDNPQMLESFQSSVLVEWAKDPGMEDQLAIALKIPRAPFTLDDEEENLQPEVTATPSLPMRSSPVQHSEKPAPSVKPELRQPHKTAEALDNNDRTAQKAYALLNSDAQLEQFVERLGSDDRRYTNLLRRLHAKDFIPLLLNLANNPALETNLRQMIQSGVQRQPVSVVKSALAGEDLEFEDDPFFRQLISRLNEDRFYELVSQLSQSSQKRELAYQIFADPELPELAARLSQDEKLIEVVSLILQDETRQRAAELLFQDGDHVQAMLAVAENPDYAATVNHMLADEREHTGFNQLVSQLRKDAGFFRDIVERQRDPLLDGIRTALSGRPLTPEAIAEKLSELGDHLQANNWTDDAISAFNLSLRLDPSLRPAYFGRAQANLSKNMIPQAIQDYKILISLNEKDPAAYLALGRVYLDLNMLDEAIDLFDRSRKLTLEQSGPGPAGE